MTIEFINDRILKLKEEQAALSTSHDQMQERINATRIRYTQLTGAINELQELKKSLNGSEEKT